MTRREEFELLEEALELEVVVDPTTGLMWEAAGSLEIMEWADAQAYCDSLNRESFGGFSDWRLPVIRELSSLIDYSESKARVKDIPGIFCKSYDYWSGTTYASNSRDALIVHFPRGLSYHGYKGSMCYVRCVRSVIEKKEK